MKLTSFLLFIFGESWIISGSIGVSSRTTGAIGSMTGWSSCWSRCSLLWSSLIGKICICDEIVFDSGKFSGWIAGGWISFDVSIPSSDNGVSSRELPNVQDGSCCSDYNN